MVGNVKEKNNKKDTEKDKKDNKKLIITLSKKL